MSRLPANSDAVVLLPLELGGTLRLLSEDVDIVRGTVRWRLHGPHIRGVVWLAGDDPYDASDPDPGGFRCRFYSGDASDRLDRYNEPIRIDKLTCYGAIAQQHRLCDSASRLHNLAADPIPDPSWTVLPADRRTVDVRRALARHTLAARWLRQLEWTWRLQTASKIAARADVDLRKALGEMDYARSKANYAQAVLDDLAAEVDEAEACGIRPLPSRGRGLCACAPQARTPPRSSKEQSVR